MRVVWCVFPLALLEFWAKMLLSRPLVLQSSLKESDSDLHTSGADELTCRKYTHKTTCPMQSRYGFDFDLRGSAIVAFSVRVDLYLSADFWFRSWFVVSSCHRSSWTWLLGNQRDQGSWPVGVWGDGAPGWPSQGILRLEISPGPGSPGKWPQSRCRRPGSSAVTRSPPGVSSLSFCVSYVMSLRTILETSRPTCDWSSSSLYFPWFPCFPLISFGRKYFFSSLTSFQVKISHKVWTFLYPSIWFPPLFFFFWFCFYVKLKTLNWANGLMALCLRFLICGKWVS